MGHCSCKRRVCRPAGEHLAERFWKMVEEYTGCDMSMLPKHTEIENFEGLDDEWNQRQIVLL